MHTLEIKNINKTYKREQLRRLMIFPSLLLPVSTACSDRTAQANQHL